MRRVRNPHSVKEPVARFVPAGESIIFATAGIHTVSPADLIQDAGQPVSHVRVVAKGAGGGGGAYSQTTPLTGNGAGGGEGAQISMIVELPAAPFTVTVGAGGPGGVYSATLLDPVTGRGGNGGDTIAFGRVAGGGRGGTVGPVDGGLGGIGTVGPAAGSALDFDWSAAAIDDLRPKRGAAGLPGGAGGGGQGAATSSATATNGCGGGGGVNASRNGGAGADGYVILQPLRALDYAPRQRLSDLSDDLAQVLSAAGAYQELPRNPLREALIAGLKADGLWSKLDRLVLFAGSGEGASGAYAPLALTNWRAPSTPLVASGGVTIDAKGVKGNGTNGVVSMSHGLGYTADMLYKAYPATVGFVVNDSSVTGVSVPLSQQAGSTSHYVYFSIADAATGTSYIVNSNGGASVTRPGNANRVGHYTAVREDVNTTKLYVDGALINTQTVSATNLNTSLDATLFRSTTANTTLQYWSDRVAALYTGASLTQAEVTALHARLTAYLDAVGAQHFKLAGTPPLGEIGVPFSWTPTLGFYDNFGAGPPTYSVASGTLPAGLSLDPATGEVSGSPTTASLVTNDFAVRVADGAGQKYTYPVRITVPSAAGLGDVANWTAWTGNLTSSGYSVTINPASYSGTITIPSAGAYTGITVGPPTAAAGTYTVTWSLSPPISNPTTNTGLLPDPNAAGVFATDLGGGRYTATITTDAAHKIAIFVRTLGGTYTLSNVTIR